MRVKLIVVMGLVFLFGLLSAQQSLAAIYKYIDKNGLITLVDDLQSVPEEYRASAKIVSGETQEKSPSIPARRLGPEGQTGNSAPDAASEKQRTAGTPDGTGVFGRKALVSAGVVVSVVFAFVILGIIDTDQKKAVKVARLVLLWGLSLYLLAAHAGDVINVVARIGGGIESVQKQSEEKGNKAAKAMKSLNALVEQAGQSSPEQAAPEAEKKE